MKAGSLQGRLLALAMAVTAAVWTVAALWVWRDASHELDELLDGHLAQAAALLVAQQAGEIEHDKRDRDKHDDTPIDAPPLHRYAPRVAFQVWHEGELVLRSTQVSLQPLADHGDGFATRTVDGVEWRVFAARGAEHDIRVYVGERTDSRASILRSVLKGSLGPLLLALPLLGAVLWLAIRAGLQPLRRLGQAVARRDPQALQPIAWAPAAVPAEIRPLVQALNALFERIAALIESERRFTADAAHELRTPIAAIRAQAQVALGAGDDRAMLRAALQGTLAGCDRAARLVDQLLMLARLETPEAHAPEPVDLVRIVRDVLAQHAPQALARRQELSLEGAATALVHGTPTLLAVLVRNLVDNALRYSPDGARVQVEVALRQGRAVLRVQDSGPGLDDAEHARLGERFFRVLGTHASGSGLGWSIVRRIAQAQGAAITVGRSAALGGLDIAVSWPSR